MQPDSGLFVGLCWVVAIALLVGAVAIGPRIAGRSLRMGAARLGAHLVTATAVMLAVLASLNAQYGWYGDWADLTGSGNVQMKTAGGGARTVTHDIHKDQAADTQAATKFDTQRAAFEKSLHLKADPGPGGQYAYIYVDGIQHGARGTKGGVLLWFPQSYTNPANKNRTYPVIEALHGTPGGTRDYHTMWFKADTYFANAMRDKQLGDAILVVPDLTPNNVDTECVDGPGIPMETWISKTVPEFVISHLRAKPEASAWNALGFSAGAWCAAMVTVNHPDRFGSGIILGGYFTPEFSNWWPFGKGKVPARYDVLHQLRTTRPKTQIWIEISGRDRMSGPGSRQFVKDARPPTSVTAVTLPHAGHRMEVWGAVLPDALAWLGQTLPGFTPTANG